MRVKMLTNMFKHWSKSKSAAVVFLLVVAVLAPPRLAPLAKSRLAPLSQALPDQVAYEDSAFVNIYKFGPEQSAPTPLLSRLTDADNDPHDRWERGAPVLSAALETPAFFSAGNDRPLYIRENDPTHHQASRVLAVRLDARYRQQELLVLTGDFVVTANTLTCLDEPAEKTLPGTSEAEAGAATGWLADIHSAWQANVAAVDNLTVIKAKDAVGVAGLRNDALKHANGPLITADGFSWQGKRPRPAADCSGIRVRWINS